MDSVSAALRAVSYQNWFAITALVSTIAVPVLGIWAMRRLTGRLRRWQAAAVWVSGCFSLLLYANVALFFAVCWGGEIGESGKNRLARAYGTPVVAALEAYRRDLGSYPNALGQLVPGYLTPDALRAPDNSVLQYPFEYRADSGRYELVVRYGGPGMNTCSYRPASQWQCGGHF